ncbi:acyl-CoA thioesterase [Sphingobium fuliginis]|uniref:Acyl-CoA thioesterase II n=1 Tax=Sphingobium fuliginis (strain ATCC 27551) TaxID=336203 RepID=A0A292ZN71_SPHSA|nr:acyl-CoA thioesterase domain-containing protein [Sphingobium fuliginis]GAY24424.1 acyl-CoA thioesterase II [Sphingobium fuliginis]
MIAADGPFHDDKPLPTRDAISDILDVTQTGPDRFTGSAGAHNHIGSVFGGRLLAQALLAGMKTVEALPASSFHAYFLAAGRTDRRLDYQVARLRDSRRFANRQITACQDGRAIFTMMAEFHAPEEGFVHQNAAMPVVPPPERVAPIQHFVRERAAELEQAVTHNFAAALAIEMRPIAPEDYFLARPTEAARSFWFRQSGAATVEDSRLQQCLLAFASDYWLGGAAAIPHFLPTNSGEFLITSMDHAMWFHGPARCEAWMLHHTSSPSAGDGLGLTTGRIFGRDGRLIASTAQECLMRRLQA